MDQRYTLSKKLSCLTGFYPGVLLKTIKSIPAFFRSLRESRRLNRRDSFGIAAKHMFPILSDREANAGVAQGDYFHQDLWAAGKIFKRAPKQHIDIGSRVDGFVAHLLVFMPVTIIDIRQLDSKVAGLSFVRDDATQLAQLANDSVESLSTLSAAEHFGLGRYSDPVDPTACFRFMDALQRVLAPGGRLYFSVPLGAERVEFNAHRVFAPGTILESFSQLRLVSFSYVGDDEQLYEDREPAEAGRCTFACGLFEFTKSS
jgi:hypothetical protein